MKVIKIIGFLVVLGVFYPKCQAQYYYRGYQTVSHNLAFGLKIAGAPMSFDDRKGSTKINPGFGVCLDYTYFFSENFGFSTGLGMSYFSARSTYSSNDTIATVETNVVNPDAYDFVVSLNTVVEQQRLMMLDIPLKFSFRYPLTSNFELQLNVGANILLPINSNFQANAENITTKAYYPQWNLWLENIPAYGLYSMNQVQINGKTKLPVIIQGVAELYFQYAISDYLALSFGAFYNLQLASIAKPSDQLLFSPSNSPASTPQTQYNGLYNGNQIQNWTFNAFGVMIGYRIRF